VVAAGLAERKFLLIAGGDLVVEGAGGSMLVGLGWGGFGHLLLLLLLALLWL
jgi:hypothetical protein